MYPSGVLVLQSYKPGPRPGWIARCMDSVQRWCAHRGYSSLVLGDELLNIVPAELRSRCGQHICPVTDLGRALWARRLVEQGWRRVVWLDADILVFDVESFEIDLEPTWALCREIWVEPRENGFEARRHVNNSVMVMAKGPTLDGYIRLATRILTDYEVTSETIVGTPLFGRAHSKTPFPLIETVAMVNFALQSDLLSGGRVLLQAHAEALGGRTHAAHFVHSYSRPGRRAGLTSPQEELEAAVDLVARSRGTVLQAA